MDLGAWTAVGAGGGEAARVWKCARISLSRVQERFSADVQLRLALPRALADPQRRLLSPSLPAPARRPLRRARRRLPDWTGLTEPLSARGKVFPSVGFPVEFVRSKRVACGSAESWDAAGARWVLPLVSLALQCGGVRRPAGWPSWRLEPASSSSVRDDGLPQAGIQG